MAHGEGNYVADADDARRGSRARTGWSSATSTTPTARSADIAGMLEPGRNVLGLMPHPERAIEPLLGGTDGLAMFRSLLESAAR